MNDTTLERAADNIGSTTEPACVPCPFCGHIHFSASLGTLLACRDQVVRQRDDLLSALHRVLRWAVRSERGMREEPLPDDEMSGGLLADVQCARRAIKKVEGR